MIIKNNNNNNFSWVYLKLHPAVESQRGIMSQGRLHTKWAGGGKIYLQGTIDFRGRSRNF